MTENNTNIDESLYSRQLYVLGKEAMEQMKLCNILISGLSGAGLELAKCIILGGVKEVSLHDNTNITMFDLGTNFYANVSDIGLNKADVVYSKLKELNPYVDVNIYKGNLDEDMLKKYNVIILVDYILSEQIKINNITHSNNIKFISLQSYGIYGNIFCDFGTDFLIKDIDGEEQRMGIMTEIKVKGDNIHFLTSSNHGLAYMNFFEVLGDDEYNGTYQIKETINPMEFVIMNTHDKTFRNKVLSNVQYKEIKETKIINFKPLEQSIKEPEFIMTDIYDWTRPQTLHTINQAIDIFKQEYSELPKSWNKDVAKRFFEICQTIQPDIKQEIVDKICFTLKGKIMPIESIIGSISAQEVMKACTGKFSPIQQWLYYDDITCLPSELSEEQSYPMHTRYDSQIAIFGIDYQFKLKEASIFVVGSGAIGCEHIKNLCMMGVGNIHITDMDTIERSNLNRQFLFRNTDIGKPKSVVAQLAGIRMNPSINIVAYEHKVSEETLNIFNDDFFRNLTCVANALDNNQARLFVDSLCVKHIKPLLESGTLGAKGNVQPIIPYLTETYGQHKDPQEQSIPVCTIKNFPNLIEHCIQWGKEVFQELFTNIPNNVIKFYKDKEHIAKLTPTELKELYNDIYRFNQFKASSFQDCVNFGYYVFNEYFVKNIQELLKKYPIDHVIDDIPFWSGSKKCPLVLNFDKDNKHIYNFIKSTAILWADMCSIPRQEDIEEFIKHIDTEYNYPKTDDYETMIQQLNGITDIDITKVKPHEFEKDDETNYHIDFITCASNLRAITYKIEPVDKHKTKGIAGRIIPAIATTTSLVSGLVSMELYKILNGNTVISKYRSSFINLGIPFIGYNEPKEVLKEKIGTFEYSIWDNFEYNDITLGELINIFDKKYNIDISSISQGMTYLYSPFITPLKKKQRMEMKLQDIYKEITKEEPQNPLMLTLVMDNDGDEDYNLPMCKIYF